MALVGFLESTLFLCVFFFSPLFFGEPTISLVSYREDIWATFPRQDEAMKYAKEHPHVHVFSYQDHMNGQRRFLVSTYEEFWRRLILLALCWQNSIL